MSLEDDLDDGFEERPTFKLPTRTRDQNRDRPRRHQYRHKDLPTEERNGIGRYGEDEEDKYRRKERNEDLKQEYGRYRKADLRGIEREDREGDYRRDYRSQNGDSRRGQGDMYPDMRAHSGFKPKSWLPEAYDKQDYKARREYRDHKDRSFERAPKYEEDSNRGPFRRPEDRPRRPVLEDQDTAFGKAITSDSGNISSLGDRMRGLMRSEVHLPNTVPDQEELYNRCIPTGINFNKYKSVPIKVTGVDVPKMVNSFEEAGLRSKILETLERCHYETPTPVQKQALPIIQAGRDLMACAQTGSGKTAAFLLPIINQLGAEGTEWSSGTAKPKALVLSPTRELAIQIRDECVKFAYGTRIKTKILYGGTSVRYLIEEISRGVDVLIATPGRLLDMLDQGHVSFTNITHFVLDEADRMVDMGFCGDIQRMERHVTMPPPERRQTLLFSATFPGEVQQMATQFLKKDYLFLAVGIVGGACSDVKQEFHRLGRFEKRDKLLELLDEMGADNMTKILIFVQSKSMADFISAFLCEKDLNATSIHGDRFQSQREEALGNFRRGSQPILVATAVAARGLDISNVAVVINFDMPDSIDEYVHRIGRTGRMGNEGRAISFFDDHKDAEIARPLVHVLQDAGQEVVGWLRALAERVFGGEDDHVYGRSRYGARDVRNVPRWKRERELGLRTGSALADPPPATGKIEERVVEALTDLD